MTAATPRLAPAWIRQLKQPAAIGALDDALAVLAGDAGTRITHG